QRAGIDAGEPDHAATFEPLIEMPRGPVVRGFGNGGVQHHAPGARRRGEIDGLDVLVVGADIADMGECERDDLPGIGRIREDLLIAVHRGIEADLAHGMTGSAKAEAFQHSAIAKHEQRRRRGVLPAAVPATLAIIVPRRVPWYVRRGCATGWLLLRHWFSGHGLLFAYSVCGRNTRLRFDHRVI